ncbi:MAG: hypothetical protein JSS81_29075 [Acidobacteria bacterium]|nr:hypothetical protein [Acidobacteriota bacterium]
MALLVAGVFAQRGKVVFPIKSGSQTDTSILSRGPIRAALTTGGTTSTSALVDHGGPVINTPTIYLIWYGNWNQTNGSDTPAGQQIIRDWAHSIGGTPHFALNSSYSTTKPISGNVNWGGETTDTGTRTRLTDAQILGVVSSAISSGRLPYNANGIYFVVTSSNVTASSGFCTQYCGWHDSGTVTAGKVRYSFIGNTKRCLTSCAAQSTVSPNNNPGVDGSISVMTHELEEATSDPDLNAWYDSTGAENADKCAWTFGHFQFQTSNGAWANMTFGGRNWLIQRNLWKSGSSWFCMVDSTHN